MTCGACCLQRVYQQASLFEPVSHGQRATVVLWRVVYLPSSIAVDMTEREGTGFTDEERRGYMNDAVILLTGFLLVITVAILSVELLLGPLVAGVIPAFSGSIIDCVWTGTESVCTGGVGARGILVVAVGTPLTIVWLNVYQSRIRPRLATRGIVP